jgi:DNA-binding MarR family transcriptional regulator/GNAT superfamily N-acetyltransferase
VVAQTRPSPELESAAQSRREVDEQVDPEIAQEILAAVTAFRRFNRFYTRRLGLFGNNFISSRFSLTEGRVLFELAMRGQSGASEIAGELSLDRGYLSRILHKFEDHGLVARSPLPSDARNSVLRLTRKGRAAFADLDRRSTLQARAALEPLTPASRSALLQSIRTIEGALDPAAPRAPFVLRPHRPGDMGWVIGRNAAIYAQEYGWDGSYEALVARICADFIDRFDARRERCWIAERDTERLGCIFCVQHPEQPDMAKLRLLLVEPAARGLGLGAALVNECVSFARACGYKRMTLWTQSILKAAHRLYQHAGFRLVKEEPHRSFGVDLIGQTWEMEL